MGGGGNHACLLVLVRLCDVAHDCGTLRLHTRGLLRRGRQDPWRHGRGLRHPVLTWRRRQLQPTYRGCIAEGRPGSGSLTWYASHVSSCFRLTIGFALPTPPFDHHEGFRALVSVRFSPLYWPCCTIACRSRCVSHRLIFLRECPRVACSRTSRTMKRPQLRLTFRGCTGVDMPGSK